MAETTNTITSSTLQSDPKIVVPAPTQDKTPYESIINGAITGLPTVQAQVDQANADNKTLLSSLVSKTGETANKEQFSQDQQNLAGVNERNKELDALNEQFNDLGAQISGLARESKAIPLKVQQKNLGTGATDAGVAPQEAGMLRENAIKALTLASEADVLGARITNTESRLARAKETAQKAVDLKYKPIEAEITRLRDLLELNKNYILDPAEKKLAEKQTIALNERARLLAEKKENDKQNTDLIINASSQGAPASVLSNARALVAKGAKAEEVASALGLYAGDFIGRQLKLKEMNLKDLEWKIKNNEFIRANSGPALAQNADGTVVKGTGASSTDRNISTIEQIIKANGKNIPDGAQTQIATSLGVINSIKELAKQNPEGEFVGMYPTAGFFGAITPDVFKRDKTISNETALGAIELKVQQWASGASLTESQTEKVMEMVPQKGDPDNIVQQKMKTLTDFMNTQISAQLSASAGIKYRAEPADYFDNSISSKVRNAVGSGYGATEVLDALAGDATYGAKIKQARESGKSDQEIVNYLQTITTTN